MTQVLILFQILEQNIIQISQETVKVVQPYFILLTPQEKIAQRIVAQGRIRLTFHIILAMVPTK